jgi:hypothetical protein
LLIRTWAWSPINAYHQSSAHGHLTCNVPVAISCQHIRQEYKYGLGRTCSVIQPTQLSSYISLIYFYRSVTQPASVARLISSLLLTYALSCFVYSQPVRPALRYARYLYTTHDVQQHFLERWRWRLLARYIRIDSACTILVRMARVQRPYPESC